MSKAEDVFHPDVVEKLRAAGVALKGPVDVASLAHRDIATALGIRPSDVLEIGFNSESKELNVKVTLRFKL